MTYKIAIASGKGGTGKTTVAVNLYRTLQYLGKPVNLVDSDVEEPNANLFLKGEEKGRDPVNMMIPQINTDICTFCGKCVEVCAFNAIMMVQSIKYIQVLTDLCHSCGACSYFCPEKGAITEKPKKLGEVIRYYHDRTDSFTYAGQLSVGEALAVPVIKKAKNKITENMVNLVDAPPGTSCPAMEVLQDADYTILVAEPTPFGVNDLKIMLDTVRKMNIRAGVVINKADTGDGQMKKLLKDENVDIMASLPFKRAIASHYAEGYVLVDVLDEVKQKFRELWSNVAFKLNKDNATNNSH
ncbi:MAG: ATP-binding protein [Bacteroidales bacterium]|nr:ATP-binding protein [Bacteroidales bacterium]MCF8337731.1 ATP-binding protein [Bacteroidales bacterium]